MSSPAPFRFTQKTTNLTRPDLAPRPSPRLGALGTSRRFTYRLTTLYVFVVGVLVVWPSVGVLLAVAWIAVLSVRWVLAHRPAEPPLAFTPRSQSVARPSLSLVVLRAVFVSLIGARSDKANTSVSHRCRHPLAKRDPL